MPATADELTQQFAKFHGALRALQERVQLAEAEVLKDKGCNGS